ncbi:MAG: 4Fe-4S binding protein, partial [Lutibacter sp.]|nr:4Fe-4S binding protein [Lutibacter sp.]
MGTERKVNNRRKFFQTSAALVGGTLLYSLIKPFEALVQDKAEEPKIAKADLPLWGMGVDVEKCVGCGKCAEACKIE